MKANKIEKKEEIAGRRMGLNQLKLIPDGYGGMFLGMLDKKIGKLRDGDYIMHFCRDGMVLNYCGINKEHGFDLTKQGQLDITINDS